MLERLRSCGFDDYFLSRRLESADLGESSDKVMGHIDLLMVFISQYWIQGGVRG